MKVHATFIAYLLDYSRLPKHSFAAANHCTCVHVWCCIKWLKQIDVTSGRPYKPTIRLVSGGQPMTSVRHSWITQPARQFPSSHWRRGTAGGPYARSVYISRLTINATTRREGGLYACVTIDAEGQRSNFDTAYLSVVDEPIGEKYGHSVLLNGT